MVPFGCHCLGIVVLYCLDLSRPLLLHHLSLSQPRAFMDAPGALQDIKDACLLLGERKLAEVPEQNVAASPMLRISLQ